jgi:protein-S-isoprenylcysteine O-methyltransferase Ste14
VSHISHTSAIGPKSFALFCDRHSEGFREQAAATTLPSLRATKFEFEKRFWIICAIYFVGFFLSVFDHTPFIVALRHLIAPSIARGSVDSDRFARAVIAIGALLVFLSAALRTWGAAYLRTEIVHDTAQHSDALVADGPFRYTRNPLYFANLPMAAGIGVLASLSGFVFLVLANWIFVYRLILREEEALRQSQGESYRAYCETVPRFWPSLRPRVPPGNRRPQWGQALGGESFVWLFGLAELLVAMTLRPLAALIVFPLGFLAHFVVSHRIRKRGRQAGNIASR